MTLARRLLVANPSMQVSDALSGSISLPSAKREVGDFELISRIFLTSSQSSITFGGIPQGYKDLQIWGCLRNDYGSSEDSVVMTFNNDTGSSNYRWHHMYGNGGGSAYSSHAGGASAHIYTYGTPGSSFLGNSFASHKIHIVDYSSTVKNKVSRTMGGYHNNSTGGRIGLTSGVWFSNTAINSITFTSNGNFVANTEFSLYGVRG